MPWNGVTVTEQSENFIRDFRQNYHSVTRPSQTSMCRNRHLCCYVESPLCPRRSVTVAMS